MGDTRFPYDEIITSWFDRFLLDEAEVDSPADAEGTAKAGGTADPAGAWRPMPKVQAFLMGAGTWLTGESWPLPETEPRTLVPDQRRGANTLWGDGALVAAARDGADDEFIADPRNPVQSIGGDLGTHSPVCADQRVVECRADVLVYSTPALEEPVAIAGDVTAELYVSADVEDADVFIKLVDVYPGRSGLQPRRELPCGCATGTASASRSGSCRARCTASPSAASRPQTTSRRGTRSGSRWPDPTSRSPTATGMPGDPNDLATDGPVAHITLHHGEGHESALHFRAYTGVITVDTPMYRHPIDSRP